MRVLHLDYETRSECDLKLAGAYVYAKHPSTQVLCAAYSINGSDVRTWAAWAGEKMPADLRRALLDPKVEVHAWNSQFERLITQHVVGIAAPIEKYRCTAAWARARGLPGKLEGALLYLDPKGESENVVAKRRGKAVMMRWCKPQADRTWADSPDEYCELVSYCQDDVISEHKVQQALAGMPMTAQEWRDFFLTEEINDRGLPIDVELAEAAATYGDAEKKELNEKLSIMTGGEVTSTGQHARVKTWLKGRLGKDVWREFFVKTVKDKDGNEVEKESTDKRAREEFLLSEDAKETDTDIVDLIMLVDDAGKASVAKYAGMAARASLNGRAQGAYLYAGAAQTKRYSSRGVQMHNLPRKTPKDVEGVIAQVKEHRIEGKVMHVLSSCLRPTITASPGYTLVWGDWSSVEARAMPWLADCQWKLDLYRQGIDVYRVNAEAIFGTPYGEVPDNERQIGKVAELSLQFGGAKGALKAMARNYGIGLEDGDAEAIVAKWRQANPWAGAFGRGLFDAYLRAVRGIDDTVGHIGYSPEANIEGASGLTVGCRLPDGSMLFYPGNRGQHKVVAGRFSSFVVTELVRDLSRKNPGEVTHRMAEVTFNKALSHGKRPERVWHGLLAENVTQGVCASLLRDCLLRVDEVLAKRGQIIGHTHDEIILEVPDNDVAWATSKLTQEMLRVPEWLPGFPLGCEVKTGKRYAK
jgi:DNA polymerase